MSVTGVTADNSASVAASSAKSSSSGSSLSMDDFFQLLSAQLQYQDPMSPEDNTQFMAQMAEFSLLEVAQNLNKSVNLSTGIAAIGKTAVYNAEASDGSSTQKSGKITSVDLSGDSPQYLIDGNWVTQSSIVQFTDGTDTSTENSASDSSSGKTA